MQCDSQRLGKRCLRQSEAVGNGHHLLLRHDQPFAKASVYMWQACSAPEIA